MGIVCARLKRRFFLFFGGVNVKKRLFLALAIGTLALTIHPNIAQASDVFAHTEDKLRATCIAFQHTLKWVGIYSFLFGAGQWIFGRRQQGKFFMLSAAIGYAFVLGVFLIFSLIEGIFGGLG